MQGIQLVTELTERNVSSEILAISGNLPPADLVEAIKVGASEAIPKPFDVFELVKKMELLAKDWDEPSPVQVEGGEQDRRNGLESSAPTSLSELFR